MGDWILDFMEVIKKRRSIRLYKKKPIPDDVMNQIFESIKLAPSAGHIQPWHFIIVNDEDIKNRLEISSWAGVGRRRL